MIFEWVFTYMCKVTEQSVNPRITLVSLQINPRATLSPEYLRLILHNESIRIQLSHLSIEFCLTSIWYFLLNATTIRIFKWSHETSFVSVSNGIT